MSRGHRSVLASLALLPTCASAQVCITSDIPDTHKSSWQENAGWMNWRDAEAGYRGVLYWSTFLSGYIWCENIGWVHVGHSQAALDGGGSYANTDNTNYGVNIDAGTGYLSGYAWGENVGWINFSGGAMATPANPARYVAAERRFYGYAWGENIGWVSLDDDEHYVAIKCPADYNADGFVDGLDYDQFNNDFESTDPDQQAHADYNRDGFIDGIDYDLFNNDFETGCP